MKGRRYPLGVVREGTSTHDRKRISTRGGEGISTHDREGISTREGEGGDIH